MRYIKGISRDLRSKVKIIFTQGINKAILIVICLRHLINYSALDLKVFCRYDVFPYIEQGLKNFLLQTYQLLFNDAFR